MPTGPTREKPCRASRPTAPPDLPHRQVHCCRRGRWRPPPGACSLTNREIDVPRPPSGSPRRTLFTTAGAGCFTPCAITVGRPASAGEGTRSLLGRVRILDPRSHQRLVHPDCGPHALVCTVRTDEEVPKC